LNSDISQRLIYIDIFCSDHKAVVQKEFLLYLFLGHTTSIKQINLEFLWMQQYLHGDFLEQLCSNLIVTSTEMKLAVLPPKQFNALCEFIFVALN
jgi:hypothetical protein